MPERYRRHGHAAGQLGMAATAGFALPPAGRSWDTVFMPASTPAPDPAPGAASPQLLEVTVDEHPEGAVVVRAGGEIDLLTAPRFADAMVTAIDGGAALVVVDLDQVTFFGSAAVANLARAAERADTAGTVFRLVVGESMATRVLEISGLADLLDLRPTVADALAG
ncbi:STAS domain-containing protein [Actinokineospora cianjurensis]|nr:STAS domain-containing protein [Actinokineospora cianjurensis]